MKKEARVLRCTLLNGPAWSTEKKVHEKIQKESALSFLVKEHRLRKEDVGGAAQQKKPRSDGELQLTQQELPKKEQAVKIESIRQGGVFRGSRQLPLAG